MDETHDEDAARLLHLRAATLEKGEPLALPLTLASMFHLPGEPEPGVPGYGRADNPTWEALEEMLGALDGAPALAFPSGMAAISAALFATLKAGDRLLLPSDGYYTPRSLATRFLEGARHHGRDPPDARGSPRAGSRGSARC